MKHVPRFYFENHEHIKDLQIFDREEPAATSVIARVYNVETAQKIINALNGVDQKIGS